MRVGTRITQSCDYQINTQTRNKTAKSNFFEKIPTNYLSVRKIALPLPSQNNERMSFQAVNKFWWWRLQLQKSRE
jgi:hypothetical protein